MLLQIRRDYRGDSKMGTTKFSRYIDPTEIVENE
jgi:hypothetical protein